MPDGTQQNEPHHPPTSKKNSARNVPCVQCPASVFFIRTDGAGVRQVGIPSRSLTSALPLERTMERSHLSHGFALSETKSPRSPVETRRHRDHRLAARQSGWRTVSYL